MLCHNDVLTCLGTGEQREARGARCPLSPARVQQQATPPAPIAGAEPKNVITAGFEPASSGSENRFSKC